MTKAITIFALMISSAATAQTATPYRIENAAPAKTDADKIVCKKQEVIGSRLGAKKVCLTVSEWDERAKNDRERTEHVQSSTCQVGEGQDCASPN
jgi:invasion protein IalB